MKGAFLDTVQNPTATDDRKGFVSSYFSSFPYDSSLIIAL